VRQGLAELGYVDGRDIIIEARWAEGFGYVAFSGIVHGDLRRK